MANEFKIKNGAIVSGSITGITEPSSENSAKMASTSWVRTYVGGNSASAVRTVQSFTATANQSTFTIVGGYTVGLLDVYLNGYYLNTASYTATNGTTVVLTDAASVDDILDVIIYSTSIPLTSFFTGTGTTDTVPKFTSSGAIGNSAIRDLTEVIAIGKRVSIDNGLSQAINITPGSGGTTNRIETSGTLPLALITSGASITLAAGGVTPQFTLTSAGAATFSNSLTVGPGGLVGRLSVRGTTIDSSAYAFEAANSNGNSLLAVRNDGESFFSNSINTTGNLNASSSNIRLFSYQNIPGQYRFIGTEYAPGNGNNRAEIRFGIDGSDTRTKISFHVANGGATLNEALSIGYTSAATFSSSITAIGNVTGQSYAVTNESVFRGGLYSYKGVSGGGTDFGITLFSEGGAGNGNIYFCPGGSATRAVTILANGNVGIGTSSIDNAISGTERVLKISNSNVASIYLESIGNKAFANFVGASGRLVWYDLTAGVDRMVITSGGNVLIGTTSDPGYRLTVSGNIYLPQGVNREIFMGSVSNYNYRIRVTGDDFIIREADLVDRLRYSYNDTRWYITGGLTVSGSLSKGSGSFKIDHPLPEKKDTHHLVHSFIEGPQADNIYRGKIDLVNGYTQVNIDQAARMTEGTFVLLNGNIQCFTSNESGWTAVKGMVNGNILTISAQDSQCTDTISWLVLGERIDQHMIDTDWTDENGKVITEPTKSMKQVDPLQLKSNEEQTASAESVVIRE